MKKIAQTCFKNKTILNLLVIRKSKNEIPKAHSNPEVELLYPYLLTG